MRSGGQQQQQQRTPATDFVKEYAAKKQLQMELAKKIREERLQQHAVREMDSGGISIGAKSKENPGPPPAATYHTTPIATGADKNVPETAIRHSLQKSVSSSLVLQVAEEDFKEATKAGIITPDQARQLWAMLSNQLIRVAPSSRESLDTTCLSNTVASLLALSSPGASMFDTDPNGSKRHFSSSTQKQSHVVNEHHGESKFVFGESISLESLRQSIAYFKEQQQKKRQEQHTSNQKHHHRVDEQDSRNHQAHHYFGEEEESTEMDYENQAPNPDEEDEMDIHGAYNKGAPPARSKVTPNSLKKKPEWNFDINVDNTETNGSEPSDPTLRSAVSKSLAARLAAQKAGARGDMSKPAVPAKSQPAGGSKYNRPHPPLSRQSNEESETDRESGGALWGGTSNAARGAAASNALPPPPPVKGGAPPNFDDIPILPKDNGGVGQLFKAASPVALARKQKEPRVTAPLPNDIGGDVSSDNNRILMEVSSVAHEPMRECSSCGRTFRVSVLARHEGVCRKQSNKPRKVFNMKLRRLEGIEGIDQVFSSASVRNNHNTHRGNTTATGNPIKIPKWKIQHEQFQAAMRAVHQQKGVKQVGGNGDLNRKGGSPGYGAVPPPMPTLPPEFDDRVPCPHCGRKFAEDVADRHIPKCATTIAKPKGIRPIRR